MKSNKQTPEMLERYQVIQGNKMTMIESEKLNEESVEEEGGQ